MIFQPFIQFNKEPNVSRQSLHLECFSNIVREKATDVHEDRINPHTAKRVRKTMVFIDCAHSFLNCTKMSRKKIEEEGKSTKTQMQMAIFSPS